MCLPEDRKVCTDVLMLMGSIAQRIEGGLVPDKGSASLCKLTTVYVEHAYTDRQMRRLIVKCAIRQILLDQAYRCVKMEGRSESGRAPVVGTTCTPSRVSAVFQVTM